MRKLSKKIISLLAVMALALAVFAACGNSENTDAASSDAGSAAIPPAADSGSAAEDTGSAETQGSYSDLMVIPDMELAYEDYAIGFRVGSDAVPEVDKIIDEMISDGSLAAIAEKYEQSELLELMLADQTETAVSDRIVEGDLAYLKDKGTITIGITLYAPMNYYDENNKLVGFDTEFAEAVCAKLGLTPEFIEINWDTKEVELAAKNIDCIWNGLTVSDERRENMEFTQSYLQNRQVVVIRKADAETYTSIDSLAEANLSAEAGSAGETAIKDDPILSAAPYTAMPKQTDTLMEVKAGTSDAAVLDYTLAKANVGM